MMNLKTLSCSFLLGWALFVPHFSRAQYCAAIGYAGTMPLDLKNLNYVVDRYNETRSWLSQTMNPVNFMSGYTVRAGYWKKYFADFGYTTAGQKVHAIGSEPPNGVERRRDLKTTFNGFNLCAGRFLRNEEKNTIGVGLSLNFISMKVKTRTEAPEEIKKEKWQVIQGRNAITAGFLFRWVSSDPGICVEPYMNFSILGLARNNASEINEFLNPKTFESDPKTLYYRATTVGLKVSFSVTTN